MFLDAALMVPSAPTVNQAMLQDRRVSLTWEQPNATEIVGNYSISVSTTPLGTQCEAALDPVVRSVPGTQMNFMTDILEEFSNISIVITAMNREGGTSTVLPTIQTPSAGMLWGSYRLRQSLVAGLRDEKCISIKKIRVLTCRSTVDPR